MAWGNSGIFGQTIMDALTQTAAIDLDGHTFKVALYNNSVTPAYSGAAAVNAFGAGTWSGTEVTGTGWVTGGYDLTSVVFAIDQPAAGQFRFDSANPSQPTTTLANIYGCMVYDDTITTPVADQGLFAVAFSGAPYSTTAGTLTITVDTNGWFYSDFTP